MSDNAGRKRRKPNGTEDRVTDPPSAVGVAVAPTSSCAAFGRDRTQSGGDLASVSLDCADLCRPEMRRASM